MLNTDVANLIWSYVLELRVSALNEQIRVKYEFAKAYMSEVMDCSFFALEPGDRRGDPDYWFKMKPWYTGLDYTDGILRYQSGVSITQA